MTAALWRKRSPILLAPETPKGFQLLSEHFALLKVQADALLAISPAVDALCRNRIVSQYTRRLGKLLKHMVAPPPGDVTCSKDELDPKIRRKLNDALRVAAKDAAIGAKLREFKFYTILLIGLSYSIEGLRALSLEVIGQICVFIQGYIVKFELIPFLLQTNILSTIGLAKAGGIDLKTLETEIESFKGSNSLANGDHPTSKLKEGENRHCDPSRSANRCKHGRKHQTSHVEPPTGSLSVFKDRNGGTFVPRKQVVRFMSCDKGLYELRANPRRVRGYTMLVKGEGYWSLSFYPLVEMKDALMKLTEDNSESSKFNIPRDKNIYKLNLDEAFGSDLGPDCRVHHQATLLVNKEGDLSLTFFLTGYKGEELKKPPSFQLFRKRSIVPT
ncbi:hypothetical protein FPOA_12584 [Fusarium poae]|uniref:Uncharacterized protein n=1 Tax=Fusarium poae TaxID=36050 RepID=A0A1B8A8N2_FUSPO|nr:hypothetical protein FPOA_12584 [Fusarium poae]